MSVAARHGTDRPTPLIYARRDAPGASGTRGAPVTPTAALRRVTVGGLFLVILDERTIHEVVVPLGMRPGNAALTYP
jgi:hypothetical protein